MGSLGLPATAMAVRSAFALLCFALLCGLAASSVVQSETETELKEGEAAGNQDLVGQALESREARSARRKMTPREKCNQKKGWVWSKKRGCLNRKQRQNRNNRQTENEKITRKECNKKKGWEWNKKNGCEESRRTRQAKKEEKKCNKKKGWIWNKKRGCL